MRHELSETDGRLSSPTTNGPDMPAVLPFVSGTALLTGGEGRMAGNAVGFWAGNLVKSTLEGRTDTQINCILADFTVTNGVAQPKVFIVDTDEVTIYGQGTIDFARQYADMTSIRFAELLEKEYAGFEPPPGY